MSEESVFVPLKVTKFFTSKVGEEFNIFIFKAEGSLTICREMVKIRIETTSWTVFPLKSRMCIWSSIIWMELRISKCWVSVR